MAQRLPVSLRRRLQLGFAAIAFSLAMLCVAAVLSLNRLGGAIATILRENYVSVIACEDMKEALERLDSAAQFSSTGHEDIGGPMLGKNRALFATAFAREANNVTIEGEGDLVREIDASYREYVSHADLVLASPPADRSARYFADLLPRFTVIKDRVQSVLRMNQASMERADRETKALARRMVEIAIATSLLAVLIASWFAWWLPRVIVRPVEVLEETALQIGEGKLELEVAEPPFRELLPLTAAFRVMLDRLRAYRASSLGELLAAKDLARATLACMMDPVIVFGRDGAAQLANEAAELAFGLREGSAEELAIAHVDVPLEIARARDEVFASGRSVLPRSLAEAMRWSGPEGERHYLVRAAPLAPAQGELASAIVVAQDVTRFRRIDELKSDMVATVSHEFKTPLTSLRMATHLLLEPSTGELTESQRELVTTARDDTERLRAMVEDLLDVVRIEREAGALHRVPIEPSGLLSEVADAHRAVARDKGVVIDVAPSDHVGVVSIDPERMAIALANLVSNAVRHTPSGGSVSLSAVRAGADVLLAVRDTGQGIDPEDLPRIWSHAVSVGASADGDVRHGLGLTIAREIVLQHGGDITATSEPGKGSSFTIRLPAEA